jgi:ketosteroid isomerase-like protein
MKKIRFFKNAIIPILLVWVHYPITAQNNDSIAVKQTVDKFIQNFNALQWDGFRSAFTEDATIFFPDWEEASRKRGIKEIEQTWLGIFPEFKDSTNTLKLSIKPRDILVQLYDSSAIVTFHLGSGDKGLARRTLVMVKDKKTWKIVHLHASYVEPVVD